MSEREMAFEECAAIADRWAADAAGFQDVKSQVMHNVCRNLAQAIRNKRGQQQTLRIVGVPSGLSEGES